MRPFVQAFAAAMEAKLAANDHKPAWRRTAETDPLLPALRAEVGELAEAVLALYTSGGDTSAVLNKAADVALYAAMIADVCEALPETTDRGRVLVGGVACMEERDGAQEPPSPHGARPEHGRAGSVRLAAMSTLEAWEIEPC